MGARFQSFSVSRSQGFKVTIWLRAYFPALMKKGAGMNPHPLLAYSSIISILTHPHRQLFQLYFASRCNELRGKSSKRGIDKKATSCEPRAANCRSLASLGMTILRGSWWKSREPTRARVLACSKLVARSSQLPTPTPRAASG